MLYYTIPSTLAGDIQAFAKDFAAFKAGHLHETAFTAKRVKMGVYLERSYNTYMCRIRCASNILTPEQLALVGTLAQQYGDLRVHVTTRAEIQVHGIRQDTEVVNILRILQGVGLSCLGGGGNTIRNIISNPDSGIHPNEVFDVQPCVVALTNRLLAEPDSSDLPRKIKTAFSSLAHNKALCLSHDLGFIACINAQGQRGYRFYAGGGLGAKPKAGILIDDFVPEAKVYHAVRAIKNLFLAHGNRKNKHRNRLKFLIHESFGPEAFCRAYQEERDKILALRLPDLDIQPIDNTENSNKTFALKPLAEAPAGYDLWQKRYVRPQKQEGLYSIQVPLLLGDLSPEDCFRLEALLRPFGTNTLRCGPDQNIYLRNIPERFLPNLYAGLNTCTSLSNKPPLYAQVLPCTGAQTCQVGINRPRPAVLALFKVLDKVKYKLPEQFNIRISGCPNSCANHWLGDLAFYGRVRYIQGHPIPTYNVLGNGGSDQDTLRLAEVVGWVHAVDLPHFIEAVLKMYVEFEAKNFTSWWQAGGREAVAALCAVQYNTIPSFAEDKNYYFDHGAEQLFSVKDMGRAECSAGIYDMIDVDDKAIEQQLQDIEAGQKKPDKEILRDIFFRSTRMLLVTQGQEAKTEREAYSLFIQYFLETGLVGAEYCSLLELAALGKLKVIERYSDQICALAKDVRQLYARMDSSLHFSSQDLTKKNQENPTAGTLQVKDLRGVRCPLNFAQTKLALARINSGELLEILLDGGDAVVNVPRSVESEGHKVLEQEELAGYWRVLIKKA
jgi:sulfite reductase (ferredoxin)